MSVEELEWCDRCHANVKPELDAPRKVCPGCGNDLGSMMEP